MATQQVRFGKDNFIVDEETGEIVGHVEMEEQWIPDTEERVDFVLELMTDLDAEAIALQSKLRALSDNMGRMIMAYSRRRKWLEHKFGPSLEKFAELQLADDLAKPKGKRSVNRPYGSLAFTVPTENAAPRVTAVEGQEAKALAWAERFLPAAVKVEKSLLMTPLKVGINQLPLDCFEIKWPTRSFAIKTGVK